MSPQASSATQPLQRTAPLTDVPPQQRPISDYTSPEVSTVAEQTPLSEVIDALILSPLKRVVVIDTEGHVKGIISDVDVLSQMQEEVRPGLLGTLAGWARSKPGRLPTATLQTSHGKARIAADLMNRDVVTVNEMTSVQVTIERMMTTRRLFITVGFLGAYTTFSSLALSDDLLLGSGEFLSALLYLALSITGGVLAVLLGDWLGLWLISKTRRTARRSMTTRTLTQQLSAHPQGKRGSTVHVDVQDDLLLPERSEEQETRHRHS